MKQLLVGSWIGADHQKDQATIKLCLGSSSQVEVNEVSPNYHCDFHYYANMAIHVSHLENFYENITPHFHSTLAQTVYLSVDLLEIVRHEPHRSTI